MDQGHSPKNILERFWGAFLDFTTGTDLFVGGFEPGNSIYALALAHRDG